MFDNPSDKLITEIFQEKLRLEKEGYSPRVVIIGKDSFNILKNDWIKSYKDLPWGDVIEEELEKKAYSKIFLGDGSLFNLWVVRVDTIKGFEVR